ncbi:hypothetical protein [Caulobacter sp. 17J80-11]|uniref:hypothetical protein n=1 Tax=Caulobacter sp. 17J80-11 TaxID=2763502 RepID=UPI0016535700|nr:hypothetical protein [Caulobacter sp. 17J80-11]MBC6981542.1 hypothetical protein [Caulobacter sp. 17J80-11]
MKALRWIVVVLILAYVAWIAVPGVVAMFSGPQPPTHNRSVAADPIDVGGPGMSEPGGGIATLAEGSVQGQAAAEAVETHDFPVIALWAGAIALYLIAAVLFANGSMRATLAYGAAFAADLVLNLLGGGQQGGVFSGVLDALAAGDLRYTVIVGAVLIGLFMIASGRPDRGRLA